MILKVFFFEKRKSYYDFTLYKNKGALFCSCAQSKNSRFKTWNAEHVSDAWVSSQVHCTKPYVGQWTSWSRCGPMTQSVCWICGFGSDCSGWKMPRRISTKCPAGVGGCYWLTPSSWPRRCRLRIRCPDVNRKSNTTHTQSYTLNSSMHWRLRIRRAGRSWNI